MHTPQGCTMNKFLQTAGCAALVLAITTAPAYADWDRGYRGGPPPSHHSHHRGGGGGGAGWVAPLLFLGLAGAAISAAATPPPVTYVQPPLVQPAPPQAPTGTWYYCASASMYYPYTQHCPEGWQAVRPSPY